MFEIVFSKENLYENIGTLISAYEEIMNTVTLQIDFISGNDDTDAAILRYEKDNEDI